MLITGQNTIVGTLNLNLRDEFQRAYRPLAIVDAQTIDVSDKFRFAPELLAAITGGFVTVSFEDEDFADQADVGTSINHFSASADDFTILHNGRSLVRVSTSPAGSFYKAHAANPIQAGTVIGQKVRISVIATTLGDGDEIFMYFNKDDGAPSTCWLNGNWLANSEMMPYIELVWDGAKWYEQERGVNTDDTDLEESGDQSVAFQGSKALGQQAFAANFSIAVGDNSAAFSNSTATGQECSSFGGTAGRPGIDVDVEAPDSVNISGDMTAFFNIGDEILLTDISNGAGQTWINRNQITAVSFGGGQTTLTLSNSDPVSGPIPTDSSATLYYITRNAQNAHSEGNNTLASGDQSHAEGNSTEASGANSHAEGSNTIATGNGSHAEGTNTLSVSQGSHAEGGSTRAYNENSHAEGNATFATGYAGHAEGSDTTAGSTNGHAEGSSSITGWPADTFTFSGSTVTIAGQDARNRFNSGDQIFFFDLTGGPANPSPLLASINVITTTPVFSGGDTTFDTVNDFGGRTGGKMFDMTFAICAHAEGNTTIARGNASHAEGLLTIAKGQNSHAEGNACYAIGNNSHAEGFGTSSIGLHSHAEGGGGGGILKAVGDYGHAEGKDTLCMAHYGHTEGEDTRSGNLPRDYSYDPNTSTVTIPGDFTSEFHNGDNTRFWDRPGARVEDATISSVLYDGFLLQTTFTATITITIGMCVVPAFGEGSHAEGDQTHAYGESSHAEGANSFAFGAQSHAAGLFSVARQTGQHSMAAGVLLVRGDAQSTELIARAQTTNGVPTDLFVAFGTEQILIPINSTFGYSIKVIARQTAGTSACAYFTLDGFITRDVGVGTTRLVTGSTNTTSDGTASTWTLVESADTGTGALVLTATGEAAKNINWVAHIRLVETFE